MNPKTIGLIERLRSGTGHFDFTEIADALEAQQARIEKLEAVREAADKYSEWYQRKNGLDQNLQQIDEALAACKEGE